MMFLFVHYVVKSASVLILLYNLIMIIVLSVSNLVMIFVLSYLGI